MSARRVLVAGGGITGLAAAWEAARAGATVTLVEAGPRLGGKVRTEQVDGLLIEHGPDSFVSYRPAALRLIDDLGLAGEVIGVQGSRRVHLRVDGRLVPLPEGMGMVLPNRLVPFATTPILSWRQKARAGADLLLPRRLAPQDTSIGGFLRQRLGDGVVDRFAQPLVGGIYGAGIDQLSLDAVLPVLRQNEREHRSLMLASLAQGRSSRRSARRSASRSAAASPAGAGGSAGSPFRSLAGGMGSLVSQLAGALAGMGVDVHLGTSVTALAVEGSGTTVALSDGRTLQVDATVLALPAPALAALLQDPVPDAAAALSGIPQASTTLVTLAVPTEALAGVPDSHGWLEADRAPISGVTISSSKWAGRAHDGLALLRAFVPERVGPLAHEPDERVLAVVSDHVGAVLGTRLDPVLTRVTRWRGVMPIYAVGHLDRVAAVEAAVAPLPGWHVAGAALHGVGLPECIADGRRAGAAAAAG